jgi:hypothetical protein
MILCISPARPEYRDTLESEIKKAHVICIVYAIDEAETFSRLSGHWLPYIRRLGVNVRETVQRWEKGAAWMSLSMVT